LGARKWVALPGFAFAHLALPVEDRDQGLVGRAAYHVGTIGEAFDDPRQILGRLRTRALWGRWGPPTFPGCQKGRVASRRPLPPGEERGRALRLMAVRQTRLWGGVAQEFGLPRAALAQKESGDRDEKPNPGAF